MMDPQRFDALTARLHEISERSPARFRLRTCWSGCWASPRLGRSWWHLIGEATISRCLNQAAQTLGIRGQFLVIHAGGSNTARVAKAIARLDGARIFTA